MLHSYRSISILLNSQYDLLGRCRVSGPLVLQAVNLMMHIVTDLFCVLLNLYKMSSYSVA
jgi:hypothetical protein